jgi:hypothetical protein
MSATISSELENFFKPEARKNGLVYFSKNAVTLSNKSDTYIQAYIKGTPAKVSLSSDSISDPSISADCSCPVSNKGQLCKHIWSVLVSVEKNYPDFLTSKTSIEKISRATPKQSAFKEKQADYKKLQYEKQKLRANQIKSERKKQKLDDVKLPMAAEAALKFFLENGFPLEKPIKEDDLNNARKKLARVFHPDVGGSHDETVVLNENYDILIDYCVS